MIPTQYLIIGATVIIVIIIITVIFTRKDPAIVSIAHLPDATATPPLLPPIQSNSQATDGIISAKPPDPIPAPKPTYSNLTLYNRSTPWNENGNGNITYFDRHDVGCPAKSGLSSFKLIQNDDKSNLHFKYNCLLGSDFGNAVSKSTTLTDENTGSILNLDKHEVTCPSGHVLNEWRLNHPNDKQMSINYRCIPVPGLGTCTQMETSMDDDGNGNASFFDKHNIKCPNNKMLNSWKLVKDDKTKKFKILYTCCGRE